jgi:hypothetical protein
MMQLCEYFYGYIAIVYMHEKFQFEFVSLGLMILDRWKSRLMRITSRSKWIIALVW